MGETGKRPRNAAQKDNVDSKQQKRRPNNKENPNDGELVVYRILCPDNVIGSVIGKGGKVINSLRQETHARIKVVDPFPGANERVVTIYCYVKEKELADVDEDDMEPLCPAQDALLRVHAAIVNALSNLGDSDKKRKQEARMLVPASQTATIIGKAGATIKRLRSDTEANIKVNQKDPDDPTHSCAMSFDNFVSISGDEESVKKALYAVSAIMYKFSPKEEISLDTTVPELPPRIIIPSDVPVFPAGSIFPSADAIVGPPRSAHPVIGTAHVPEIHGYTDSVGGWPGYPSTVPVVSAYSGPSRSEELVLRVLCPSDMIGRVIGKGGSSIKSVRQSSGARIDIDDKKNESEECVITITSMEGTEDTKSAAIEAILLLQGKINDEDDEVVSIRLLVPSKVIGCLIGKSGSIVNDMRKKTRAKIYISKGEKPKCAGSDDELVEVQGDVGPVRDALVQIVLRLRDDALKDRDGSQNAPPVDSFKSSGHPVPAILPRVPTVAPPPVAHIGYDQRAEPGYELGTLPSSSLYGYSSLQGGENGYGSLSSYAPKTYGGLPSFIEMVIPANAVGKVMGKSSTNLVNIRKISGASVEIIESKTSRGERIAQISGTPEQKRTAENLIQAFIMAS